VECRTGVAVIFPHLHAPEIAATRSEASRKPLFLKSASSNIPDNVSRENSSLLRCKTAAISSFKHLVGCFPEGPLKRRNNLGTIT
jgi:hypothetical protein